VAAECIAALERLTLGDFRPDLTLLFDVPVEVGRERLADGRPLDKFERQQPGFFERVRATYLTRAAAEPSRFRVIDSTRPQADVRADLAALVAVL
jgi:dTMP kinase